MRVIDADAFVEENKNIIDNSIDTNRYEVTLRELINEAPTVERPQGKWEYLKEHITEMRDADGKLNQKETCQFILNLMGVIEREGEAE